MFGFRMMKRIPALLPARRLARLAAATLFAAVATGVLLRSSGDWASASHEAVGLAPAAARTPEAVVQVYAARAWGWRGVFGVHTWVAVKPEGAASYTVHEVIGWRLGWSRSVVVSGERAPDARWFGSVPELLADVRGARATALVARIEAAAASYPYAAQYRAWPGPNSNTFTAWITRAVPELGADLPPTAIGKDYLGSSVVGAAPSGSGLQLSVFGVLGVTASAIEGLEVNLLGLGLGVDPFPPALRLPLVGRLGMASLRAAD